MTDLIPNTNQLLSNHERSSNSRRRLFLSNTLPQIALHKCISKSSERQNVRLGMFCVMLLLFLSCESMWPGCWQSWLRCGRLKQIVDTRQQNTRLPSWKKKQRRSSSSQPTDRKTQKERPESH